MTEFVDQSVMEKVNFFDIDNLNEDTFAKELEYRLQGKLLYLKNKKKFVFYNGVYWEQCRFSEINHFFNELVDDYLKIVKSIDILSIDQKKNARNKILRIDKRSYREKILKILQIKTYREDINWNENKNLFVFNDAIFDCSICEFIEPKPERYINQTCGYSFFENDDYLHRKIIPNFEKEKMEIMNFFRSTFEDEAKINELLRLCALCLKRGNPYDISLFFVGNGSNGKSVLIGLLNNTFGNYFLCERTTSKYSLFKLNQAPMFHLNKLNKMDSLYENPKIIQFPFVFIEDEEEIMKNPFLFKKRKSDFKNMFEQSNYARAFLLILFEVYAYDRDLINIK